MDRSEHEEFVSNHTGSKVGCVILCLAHAPGLVWCLKFAQGSQKSTVLRDFACVSLPVVVMITVLSDFYQWTSCLLIVLMVCIYISTRRKSATEQSATSGVVHSTTSYITLFKGLNVLLTCMAILAVDFQIFPRRFAKTETFGVSVMDIGVGTFIVSSAITSKYARGKEKVRSGSSTADRAAEGSSLMSRLSAYSLQHIMVLCLGVGRLVLLKVLNYQEHVSEYGVHWNFFVTLFSVWTAVDLLHAALPRQFVVFASLAALAAYQALLLCTPLTDYMMSDVRKDIISANKEGIVSLLGYVPLYLLSEEISRALFFPTSVASAAVSAQEVSTTQTKAAGATKSGSPGSASGSPVESAKPSSSAAAPVEGNQRSPPGWNLQLVNRLAVLSTVFWLGWWAATSFVQPTSRRLVNAAYVLLTLAIATAMIFALYLVDTATARLGASPVLTLQYMSTHSLAVFLAANVMTGVVNMSMDTIHAADELALSVLCCYALAVTCAAWAAESFLSPSQPSKLRT